MNVKTLAVVVGGFVALLGIIGLLGGETRLMDAMNINLVLDIARIGLGALLIISGLRNENAARTAFTIFGFAYLGMFALGLLSPTLYGMLPDGLGWLDQTLHIGGGLMGLYYTFIGSASRSSSRAHA